MRNQRYGRRNIVFGAAAAAAAVALLLFPWIRCRRCPNVLSILFVVDTSTPTPTPRRLLPLLDAIIHILTLILILDFLFFPHRCSVRGAPDAGTGAGGSASADEAAAVAVVSVNFVIAILCCCCCCWYYCHRTIRTIHRMHLITSRYCDRRTKELVSVLERVVSLFDVGLALDSSLLPALLLRNTTEVCLS